MKSLLLFLVLVLTALSVSSQELSRKSERQVKEAKVLYEKGLHQEAIEVLKKVLFRTSRQPDLQIFAAQCYFGMNDQHNAKIHLKKASKIGSHKADQLLDSLNARSGPKNPEQFENDLEKYFQKTAPD